MLSRNLVYLVGITGLDSIINDLPYSENEEVSYPYYEKFYNAVNSYYDIEEETPKRKTKKIIIHIMIL